MATKATKLGEKRKQISSEKPFFKKKPKKPKLEYTAFQRHSPDEAVSNDEDDFGQFSDTEAGARFIENEDIHPNNGYADQSEEVRPNGTHGGGVKRGKPEPGITPNEVY
jgi:hypothetical protein